MTLIARPAMPCLAVDTDFPITDAMIGPLKAYRDAKGRSIMAVARYVALPNNPSDGDISASELARLTDASLGVWLVQHPRSPGWNPAAHSGGIDGDRAANLALAAGYPLGCHLYLDVEGCALGASPIAAINFAEDWSDAVNKAGYLPALYRGYDSFLTPGVAYSMPRFSSYWLAPGQPPTETRGDAIVQGATVTIAGVGNVDCNEIVQDKLGSLPTICFAA